MNGPRRYTTIALARPFFSSILLNIKTTSDTPTSYERRRFSFRAISPVVFSVSGFVYPCLPNCIRTLFLSRSRPLSRSDTLSVLFDPPTLPHSHPVVVSWTLIPRILQYIHSSQAGVDREVCSYFRCCFSWFLCFPGLR